MKKATMRPGRPPLPSRIEAAFGALRHLAVVQGVVGGPRPSGSGMPVVTQLEAPEKALKNCALETLRNYITGEDSCQESSADMNPSQAGAGDWNEQ